MIPCQNCGALMSAASEMCTVCCHWVNGTPTNFTGATTNPAGATTNPAKSSPTADPKPTTPPRSNNQLHCPNCDERVFSLDTKCPKCGIIPRGEFRPKSNNKTVLTVVGIVVAAILVLSTLIIILVKSDVFKSSPNQHEEELYTTAEDVNEYEATNEATAQRTPTISYPDDERRTFATNTWLRSSPSKSGDGNKLELVAYGTAVTQLSSSSDEWTKVRINSTGNVGYMATEFLLTPVDFLKINSFFGSVADREKLSESKYRLALREYATNQKTAGPNDSEAQIYFKDLGYSKTELVSFSTKKLQGTQIAGIYRFSNNTVAAYLFNSNSNDYKLIGICSADSFNGVSQHTDQYGDYYIQIR